MVETEAEQRRITRECHEGTGNSVEAKAMSGHFGRDKTIALIQSKVYFPGFRQKTIDYIKICVACQHVKCGGKFEKGGEKLKSIPVPRMPMRQLGIDCITNLPKTDEGYDTIVTAIDYTSKWPESKPLEGKFAEGVAEFMYKLACHHGAAKIHISEQGREFVNQVCVISHSYTMYICIFMYNPEYLFSLIYFCFFFFCCILRLLTSSMSSQTSGTTLPVPIIPRQMVRWRDSTEQPKRPS